MEWSFPRYLAAKKTVDDRALNRTVWESLKQAIRQRPSTGPLRVLELGMGIGTMFQRVLEWGLFEEAVYIGIDAEQENINAALRRIPLWAQEGGYSVYEYKAEQGPAHTAGVVQYAFIQADLFDFLKQSRWQNYFDLVIANALLDLVDLHYTMPLIRKSLKASGLGYFTINFDGMTAFEPLMQAEIDEKILSIYHQSMNERQIPGDSAGGSTTGRRLFTALGPAGFDILEAGSSDWLVYPQKHTYADDEAYFLYCMLQFFEETIPRYAEQVPEAFQQWLELRRSQIEAGTLVFLAHQLDFLVQAS
jgi:hypothetical protein